MIGNAYDIPGLKTLNSDTEKNNTTNSSNSVQNSSDNNFAGNPQSSNQSVTSRKENITRNVIITTNSSDRLR
jgi:hypothetical protein